MAPLTRQLFLAAFVLGAVQLITGYSFDNCVEDPYYENFFKCNNRKSENITQIINGLPPSVFNLTISGNPIQHVPNNSFANLSNLWYLRLDKNQVRIIGQLAFQNLHQLNSLNLSSNNISELDSSVFSGLSNLTFLSLTKNTLEELPRGIFSAVPKLATLLMRKNLLRNFSGIVEAVSHLMNLRELDLCSNKLTSLSQSNMSLPKSLTKLNLCRNNLLTLGCEQWLFQSVNWLDVSYNSNLTAIAFKGVDLSHVKTLHLSSTNITVVEFLNISNISAGSVDFSGTGLENDNMLKVLCRLLKKQLKSLKNFSLTDNNIRNLTNKAFHSCPKIEGILNLSHNDLKTKSCLNFLKGQTNITKLTVEHNHLNWLPSCKTQNITNFRRLENLSYRYNRILFVDAHAFYHTPNIKTLQLNINNIAYLDRKALNGLTKLETLRLDNNLLTDLYNVTFQDNVNLKTLNLRNNRISVIFNSTFSTLKKLTTLDLGGNKISQIQISGLDGLKSLSKLYLDGNNLKEIKSSYNHVFRETLTVLDLQANMIRFNTDEISSPFVNLRNLRDLKMDGQRPHGLSVLPRNLFRGLHSLRSLYLTNNKIFYIPHETFDDLTSLRFLTLDDCCLGVGQLQPGVFKNLRNLTKLVVENMSIQNFSTDVFGNLTQLQILQLNHNVMENIPVDALESLPKLRYLDIRNIPLSCTCKNSLLQNYTVHNPNVQVVFLRNLPCPQDKSNKFYKFDTRVCYIDLGEYMFFSTATVIFLFTLAPLLYVKLYWKMKYGFYVFRSWFSEQWSRLREEEENCKYDAFISYNSSDEDWVMNHLLPNLEGKESSFKLCLHHRDFELGRDIVDNIVNAVYSSRKTICVVSRSFLQSEWCSLEIQLASYRLFDEHRDVLLLVFLEPISERQLSSYHRMRKVMLKKTYLQWPSSSCTDPLQAQELFWNQLCRAIRAGSRLETEEDDCIEAKKPREGENHVSDENCYLQP